MPVTIPLPVPKVIRALLVLHSPPLTASVSVVLLPTHTSGTPPIGASGLTVTVCVAVHPVGNVYDMTVVPSATPVNNPVPVPMVATDGVLLLHVPPGVASDSV